MFWNGAAWVNSEPFGVENVFPGIYWEVCVGKIGFNV